MPYIPNSTQNTGLFIPTTTVYDVSQIIGSIPNISQELREVLVVIYQNVNNVALALNAKSSGIYDLQEFVNGKIYFNPDPNNLNQPRSNFSQTYYSTNSGAGIGAGVTTIPHNLAITTAWNFTDIYGVANDTAGKNYYPLPWASAAGATNIELKVNATNIVITNNSGITFTNVIVTLEYLKN